MVGWGDPPGSPTSGGIESKVIPIGTTQVPYDTEIPDKTKFVYSDIYSVPASLTVDIITFIVPVTPIIHLLNVSFGSTNIARYHLYFNANIVDQYVTWFNGGGLTGVWDFRKAVAGGLQVDPNLIIKVKGIHGRPFSGDFWAKIYYMEIF